jgi:DNA-directed RNA polymerase sigma subunit (sigma70/sigma32)
MVFREIAERLNLTPSRIKQIETETMKKVAKKLAGI